MEVFFCGGVYRVTEVNLEFGGVTLDHPEVVIGELLHVIHAEYNSKNGNNDIALVRLSNPINYTGI